MVIRRFDPDHAGIAATVRAANEATVRPLTDAIYDDSQRYVPVLTGALRASGRKSYSADFSHGEVSYGEGLSDKRAIYQEAGTSIMTAQPYLRPAAYRRRSL
jgi:HK97 gp10 family phage protein